MSTKQRRQVEYETLAESEARFRAIVEMAPDAIFIAGQNGRFLEVNAAACEQLEYTREELLQMSVFDIVAPSYAEQARRHIALMEPEYSSFESCHSRRDGSCVPVELSIRIISYEGRPAMVAVVRDITERKKVEDEKWAFYRETIFSVTGGKLQIASHRDLNDYFTRAQFGAPVRDAADVHAIRIRVEDYAREEGLEGDDLTMFSIAVGEAATNAVKHAGGGEVYAGSDGSSIWAMASDSGPGIDTLALPKVALLRGFSTKASLGLGYSVMLESCDRILLATTGEGTTVVLIKDMHRNERLRSLDDIPDTWDQMI